jgi:ABC-type uncharacterized transport system substrate-binding protein
MESGRMKRRQFITLFGTAMAVWPLAARTQEAMPVIGLLSTFSSTAAGSNLGGLKQGLNETGYSENQNVAIEYRWAEGHYDRLPGLMADLVGRRVAVIVAWGPPAARVAKAATSTIPIVFSSGDDPVQIGLVPSMNRPGGNVTGVYLLFSELGAKKLGLLHDLLPRVAVVGVLLNPNSPTADAQAKDLQLAGRALGLKIQIVNASSGVPVGPELRAVCGKTACTDLCGGARGNSRLYRDRREFITLVGGATAATLGVSVTLVASHQASSEYIARRLGVPGRFGRISD